MSRDTNRPVGYRGLAAGVLHQALEDTITSMKAGWVGEAAAFLFSPDREEDRSLWVGLAGLDDDTLQRLAMQKIRKAFGQ